MGGRENDVNSVMPGDINRAVHPRKFELPGRRFEERPGEFSHADRVEAEFAHLTEVNFPFRRFPPFGVVGRTEEIVLPWAPCTQGTGEGADPQECDCAIEGPPSHQKTRSKMKIHSKDNW